MILVLKINCQCRDKNIHDQSFFSLPFCILSCNLNVGEFGRIFSSLAEFFSCNFAQRGACSQAKHSITSLCFSTPPLLKLWWLLSVPLLEDIWHHLLVLVFLPKLYATGS